MNQFGEVLVPLRDYPEGFTHVSMSLSYLCLSDEVHDKGTDLIEVLMIQNWIKQVNLIPRWTQTDNVYSCTKRDVQKLMQQL